MSTSSLDLGQVRGQQGIQGIQGQQGIQGIAGADGSNGSDGVGVPDGGTAGQFLRKASSTDYDTEWETLGVATQQAAGLMSASDKGLVDFIPSLKVATDLGEDTLENIQAKIITLAGQMSNLESRLISFTVSVNTGLFGNTRYIGQLIKHLPTRMYVILFRSSMLQEIIGRYDNGVFSWDMVTHTVINFTGDIDSTDIAPGEYVLGATTSYTHLSLDTEASYVPSYCRFTQCPGYKQQIIFAEGGVMTRRYVGTPSAWGRWRYAAYNFNETYNAETDTVYRLVISNSGKLQLRKKVGSGDWTTKDVDQI